MGKSDSSLWILLITNRSRRRRRIDAIDALQRSSRADVTNIREQSVESEEPIFDEIGVGGCAGTVEEDVPVQVVDLDDLASACKRRLSLLLRHRPQHLRDVCDHQAPEVTHGAK
jgi:hypothetical protein